MTEQQQCVDSWLEKIAKRMEQDKKAGAAPHAELLTVREFLHKFGKARRGYKVVGTVRQKLEKHRLRTSPDFEFEYIDNTISVEFDEKGETTDTEEVTANPTVRVDSLASAHNRPVSVAPDDPIERATTIMQAADFSQLPVMTTEKTVKGAISWRSIGMAYAEGRFPKQVRECMEDAREIDINTTLIEAMNEIRTHDYVIIHGADKTVTGIVTATDLGDEFRKLAQPFLLIGEIEHHLRNLVRGQFTAKEFADAAIGAKNVRGPDDLTLGDYCQLLGNDKSWKRISSRLDRKEFLKLLDEVRNIRNDIMHFSADEIEPESLDRLEKMLRLLR